MFPELNNLEFLVMLLTLWSMWYLATRQRDIGEDRRKEAEKKRARRRLRPRSADDCWRCQLGLHLKRRV